MQKLRGETGPQGTNQQVLALSLLLTVTSGDRPSIPPLPFPRAPPVGTPGSRMKVGETEPKGQVRVSGELRSSSPV